MPAEVIVAVTFGVVMFLLALITVWQGRSRHRNRPGTMPSHPSFLPVAHFSAGDVEQRCPPSLSAVRVIAGRGEDMGQQTSNHPGASSNNALLHGTWHPSI